MDGKDYDLDQSAKTLDQIGGDAPNCTSTEAMTEWEETTCDANSKLLRRPVSNSRKLALWQNPRAFLTSLRGTETLKRERSVPKNRMVDRVFE